MKEKIKQACQVAKDYVKKNWVELGVAAVTVCVLKSTYDKGVKEGKKTEAKKIAVEASRVAMNSYCAGYESGFTKCLDEMCSAAISRKEK